jgi:hypothetical protein
MRRRTRTLILVLYLAIAELLLGVLGAGLSRGLASLGSGTGRPAEPAADLLDQDGVSAGGWTPPACGEAAEVPVEPDAPADLPADGEEPAAEELSGYAPQIQRSPERIKGPEELRVERLIETTFQEYFREYTIGGRRLTVRMPFALNGEREANRGYTQTFYRDGKGTPEELWPRIDAVLASRAFGRYMDAIAGPDEKVIVFNLVRRSYTLSRDPLLIEALNTEAYPGTPTQIFVRRGEAEVSEADIYNYLYAVASIGVDCSGLSYHIQESVARVYGIELDRVLGDSLRVKPREVRHRVGIRFFDPANGYTDAVSDRIEDLRPADMLLFRGRDGTLKHSAVIQSIDLREGLIRYVQSTDWAIQPDRGVHLSMIRFDPYRAGESLRHYSVLWLQQVRPPFEGEQEPRDWQTDGDRYLWYTDAGGSIVARPKLLAAAFLAADPRFYTNAYPEEPSSEPSPSPPGGDPPASASPTVCATEAVPSLSRRP